MIDIEWLVILFWVDWKCLFENILKLQFKIKKESVIEGKNSYKEEEQLVQNVLFRNEFY